jgi:hypothetical protein
MVAAKIRCGTGAVLLNDYGAPAAFLNERLPGITFLLSESTESWHTPDRSWGSGFVVTDKGAAQWAAPDETTISDDAANQRFRLNDLLSLRVERTGGDRFREAYRWNNTGNRPVQITSLAVSTPWRDIYESGEVVNKAAIHAHMSASGAQAWVLAKPMHGRAPFLGLILRQGQISAYSVEGRNQFTGSDVRGHLLLHVTDAARHPTAFGGQPTVTLLPGASYYLAWDLGWYEDETEFLNAAERTVRVPRLSAVVGEPLLIEHPRAMVVRSTPAESLLTGADGGDHQRHLRVEHISAGSQLTSSAHGLMEVDVGTGDTDAVRVGVFFHEPVKDLVRRRVGVILDHQRPGHRPAPRGFVACDTRTGLTVTDQGWPDWSDAAERTAMPILLAEARARGLVEQSRAADVDQALGEFAQFVSKHLVMADGWVRRGSTNLTSSPRLYNTPWVVDFLELEHSRTGRQEHLELATWLLEASARHGVSRHLSIGHPQAIFKLESALGRLSGQAGVDLRPRIDRLLEGLKEQAFELAARGGDLPAHEVSYEQSIVAPLVSLLSLAYRRWPDERLLDATKTALGWLLAFAGPQPHARLRHIAIRHWDGYWFGLRRQWGDTFPHYWSALTAVALLDLPDELRSEDCEETAQAILRANLALYDEDARGCCAFLYPSCVDGIPAHGPDPLDNDQDWALIYALRSGLFPDR